MNLAKFEIGATVNHSAHGLGIVQRFIGDDRVFVKFIAPTKKAIQKTSFSSKTCNQSKYRPLRPPTRTKSTMQVAAEAALDKGFSVFALSPGTKIPRKGTKGHLDATALPAEIESYGGKTRNTILLFPALRQV